MCGTNPETIMPQENAPEAAPVAAPTPEAAPAEPMSAPAPEAMPTPETPVDPNILA